MRWIVIGLAACTPSAPDKDPTGGGPSPPAPTSPPDPPGPDPWISTGTVPPAVPPVLAITPPGGLFAGPVEIAIAVDDPDATVVFTTDGTVPTIGVSPEYAGPFTLDTSGPVRVVAENEWGRSTASPVFLQIDPSLDGFSTDLPVAVLWSTEDAPEWKSATYTPFSVTTFEPALDGRVTLPAPATLSERAGLKVRGSSSAGYPKRPYRLEVWEADADLDRDVVMLGMPADADWVFLAPLDFDRAFVRDALVYALSNSIGRYAPRTRFAEVFVADRGEAVGVDDYVGIYVIEERIERGDDRVAITELLPTDLSEPEITGGYLFKEDRQGPGEAGFTAGTAGGALDFQQPFVYVDPAEALIPGEQAAYLQDLLDELGMALVSDGFVHPVTGRHYSDLIDADAWIDHHVLNVFPKNPDAFRLSGYFHKDREGPIAAGPVWDFDRTIGCASDSRCDDPTWWDASNTTSDTTEVFDHGFWRGLFADPAFRAAYFARLDQLLSNELSKPAVDAILDAMAAELAEAAPRSYAAWPGWGPTHGSFEGEVEHVRSWLDARRSWMQGCLSLPDPRTCIGD